MSIKPVGYVPTGTPEEIKAAYEHTRQGFEYMCNKTYSVEPVLKEFKLIVAGGRDFANADLLARVLIAMADVEYADYNVSIVSGMARGADKLAYEFAKYHDIQCYEFPAEWSIGKRAGYMRNTKMGQFSDGLLAFSNGSHGTKHMIEYMKSLGKPVTVVNY